MSSVQPFPVAELRTAGWSDLDAVMEVMGAAFDPRFGEGWTRAQCAGILPMAGVTLTLANGAGPPLGFSLVRRVADESELLLLAVAPAARRQGIGTQLLDRFAEEAGGFGVRKLHLEVRDGNPAAELYRGHDFIVEGRRRKYYRGADGQLHDALTMIRRI
ncbi:MAG: Ribosomal-protein-S18p-alanine acetyltransferase [uncultured Sphingomonas sp.]|uniref:Ribosomal-protein-S18p-alanine acetyltransferase n=1 Tax=uncultured Sphingomonas sp. TaxID=158754 RepID=A0A6J4TNU2_9SPHN|nr:GNAT family N-acetyltransferase [uncultured Sphingomonas sp.]CAA9527104.1 MAG: Ribosomal-protein-S18p-alanine acetyltransferase [uncultured Sphingomonas sp.]